MPGVVGLIKVNSVSGGAVFHVGDVFNIAPHSALKTFAGAGSFNTGNNMKVYNNHNVTRTNDQDFIDDSNVANN